MTSRRRRTWSGCGRGAAEIGLPADDGSPLLVDAVTGKAVGAEGLPLHLRRARLTQVNMEANGSICGGMLRHRYGSRVHDVTNREQGELEEVR